jgi:hypothetical protein
LKAGDQAAERSANKEAVSHLKTGIALLEGALDTVENGHDRFSYRQGRSNDFR